MVNMHGMFEKSAEYELNRFECILVRGICGESVKTPVNDTEIDKKKSFELTEIPVKMQFNALCQYD